MAAPLGLMAWRELTISSAALRGNALGDPSDRPLFAWVPADTSRRYPTVYVLHAHMRSARSWFNVTPFEASYPDEISRLAPDAVVVLVDGWSSVGGSQWIDSAGIGAYGTYLREEVLPFVDRELPTIPEAQARALQGKSSGGYGAFVTALERPDLFGAVAAHAPDALFEVTVAHGFPAAARALRDRYEGSPERFWDGFAGLRSSTDALLVELLSASLAYSDGALPFDVETAEPVPDVWARWLARDPVRVIADRADAAASLGRVWLDAGNADEYFLDLGAGAVRRALAAAGLGDDRVRFELYDGGHGGTSWRYPLSLDWLVRGLSISL